MIKKLTILTVASVFAFGALEIGAGFMTTGGFDLGKPAEARIGRPLTPVSVAGVGRRTVRRCAVGIYNC